jgi:hypothetical protein
MTSKRKPNCRIAGKQALKNREVAPHWTNAVTSELQRLSSPSLVHTSIARSSRLFLGFAAGGNPGYLVDDPIALPWIFNGWMSNLPG